MRLSRPEFLIVLVGLILTAFYAYGHKLDGDVVQLFDRALALLEKGQLIPYGPATSSGASGHVPGVFLSLAVGLPMLIYPSPWLSLSVLAFLHLLAFLMLRSILRPFVNEQSLLLLGVMFWLNPYRASEVFLWNPGYMFFASVFHFWTVNKLSDQQNKGAKILFSGAHVFSLFLAAQIHPSVIILAGISFILWGAGRVKVSWSGAGIGFAFGLGSLLPFFIEAVVNPEIFPKPGNGESTLFYGLTHIHPMLKSLWYWILFGSFISQTHVFHKTSFIWLESQVHQSLVHGLFQVVKYFFAVCGVTLSFYVNILFARAYKPCLVFWKKSFWKPSLLSSLPRPFFVDYTCTAFLMSVAASALSPASTQYWHVLFVMPTALVPMIWVIDQIVFSEERQSKIQELAAQAKYRLPRLIYMGLRSSLSKAIVILATYFVVFNFFAAVRSHKYDWSESLQSRFEHYRSR